MQRRSAKRPKFSEPHAPFFGRTKQVAGGDRSVYCEFLAGEVSRTPASAGEVSNGHDADHLAVLDHRQVAEPTVEHDLQRILDLLSRCDGHRVASHPG